MKESLKEGNWRGIGLKDYVVLFPTPTVIHAARGNHDEPIQNYLDRVRDWKEGKSKGKPGMSLGVAVKMFPTPTAREAKDFGLVLKGKPRKYLLHSLGREISQEHGLDQVGRLNPEWVEWLMGWPIGWTDCERAETE